MIDFSSIHASPVSTVAVLACDPAFTLFILLFLAFDAGSFPEARPEAEVALPGDFLEWGRSREIYTLK
jgi:hypothetical protein